ncbi:MAG: lipocalin-like domain-containing protein [Bacteroidaceae bacterium]|nr:lipocalin-like domain-containing protein [Bacteroidaceae bacterium]
MNNTKLHKAIALVAILLTTGGCDKTPMNGPLDGQWQLMSIATPNGLRDTKANATYLCFQLHLTQWARPERKSFYAHFTHVADSIRFFDFVSVSAQTAEGDNDEWVTPRQMNEGALDDWGIHSVDITYHVRQLNSSSLVLEREDTVLSFRKF